MEKRIWSFAAALVCSLLFCLWSFANETAPPEAVGEEEGETQPPTPSIEKGEAEEIEESSLGSEMNIYDRRLTAPLGARPLNGLNATVLVPRLEAADTISAGWGLRAGFAFAENDFSDTSGTDSSDIDAQFRELRLGASYGFDEKTEVSLELPFAVWDGDLSATKDGVNLYESNSHNTGLGDPLLEGKYRFWESPDGLTSAAAVLGVKMGIGDEDEYISTGGWDFALAGLITHRMTPWSLHGRLGYTFVGSEDAYRSAADLDVENVISLGFQAAYQISSRWAVLGGMDWHTNAFDDVGSVEGFDSDPWNLQLGARWYPPVGDIEFPMGVELGLSFGLNDSSSDWGLFLGVSKSF